VGVPDRECVSRYAAFAITPELTGCAERNAGAFATLVVAAALFEGHDGVGLMADQTGHEGLTVLLKLRLVSLYSRVKREAGLSREDARRRATTAE
jgi:hypothetical protein